MIVIRPLEAQHCSAVAQLHIHYLRTKFSGWTGVKLLQAYYKCVTEEKGAVGFVAVNDGTVVGYVCGVWDPSALRSNLLRNYLSQILFWGSIQCLIHPTMVFDFFQRFRRKNTISIGNQRGYELRPIVVDPTVRGTGLAGRLVSTLISDAQKRHFKEIFLITEDDNEAANLFYRKIGFKLIGKVNLRDMVYNHYECSTIKVAS